MSEQNRMMIESIAASLCYAMGAEYPKESCPPNPLITDYVDRAFQGGKAERLFLYNPDAVAEWVVDKYPDLMSKVRNGTELQVPLQTEMPSVTPVCFASFYTGAKPVVHGITKYEKKLITIDTVFDALIRADKKPVILAQHDCSMATIFRERPMDYFIFDDIEEEIAFAAELLMKDEYDAYFVYDYSYDHVMHRRGPEGLDSLAQLKCNDAAFATLMTVVKRHWKKHNVFAGFAMDHGCHEIDGGLGSHGLDMKEDLFIRHFYQAIPKSE